MNSKQQRASAHADRMKAKAERKRKARLIEMPGGREISKYVNVILNGKVISRRMITGFEVGEDDEGALTMTMKTKAL
jgi:hypothetical protein